LQPAGFTIEINNTNATNVMVGLRVQVGTQTVERVPSYLEVYYLKNIKKYVILNPEKCISFISVDNVVEVCVRQVHLF
jgi:hypothetical protein